MLKIGYSACPHDCPSTCALDVELLALNGDIIGKIGRIRGAKENSYTRGVICAKVARYAERVHHPERLLYPLRRKGERGSGSFERLSWPDALDCVAEAFFKSEAQYGSEAVWPYFYAGTMGLVQRDGIHRLRHVQHYSGQFDTICTNLAWTGFAAGTGRLSGADPREMAQSDLIIIWGTNAAATQVNVMTHAVAARKQRGAKIVVIDIYQTQTMQQADLALCLKPGTDGALAAAVMHILFRDGYADFDYMRQYADCPDELAKHLFDKTPEWAANITGLSIADIEVFARMIGTTKRSFFRLGYGFSRQRNGAHNMHAASCISVVTGAWQYKGGGAFHSNSAIYALDKTMVEGLDAVDPSIRQLDQSRIGAVLTGGRGALHGGPPVSAMLIQNTNPMSVTPDQERVRAGFSRDDLFVCVHEQFMSETALMADIILPATMFLEHDDIYKGGGQQHLLLGPKLIDAPGEARDNHFVIQELAKRLGAQHPGFQMSAREHIDWMLRQSGYGSYAELEEKRWIDLQPDFETSHYIHGFAHPDKRFHFKVDWRDVNAPNDGLMGPYADIPEFPDYWPVIEEANSEGIWPNASFVGGKGINTLTGADATAPYGGAAFHDNHVRIQLHL